MFVRIASEISTGDHLAVAETLSISLGGVSILTDDSFAIGKTVWLTLMLADPIDAADPDDEDDEPRVEAFDSSATVRWTKDRADGMCVVGLQFGPMTAAQKLRLDRALDSFRNELKSGTGT